MPRKPSLACMSCSCCSSVSIPYSPLRVLQNSRSLAESPNGFHDCTWPLGTGLRAARGPRPAITGSIAPYLLLVGDEAGSHPARRRSRCPVASEPWPLHDQ
ncbi:hypothetical protein IG631_04891 [Alternaria alternata]|nr:hypothetical protein IG631_04891 [Alternaria alternata]